MLSTVDPDEAEIEVQPRVVVPAQSTEHVKIAWDGAGFVMVWARSVTPR